MHPIPRTIVAPIATFLTPILSMNFPTKNIVDPDIIVAIVYILDTAVLDQPYSLMNSSINIENEKVCPGPVKNKAMPAKNTIIQP